ncbi:hypothetical protein KDV70_20670, partial [Citrobacter cronae]|uniref:hypothetical protein n=1 Tax=Citrobacter cronae TaxID=1748967 RepID=UPI0033378BA5
CGLSPFVVLIDIPDSDNHRFPVIVSPDFCSAPAARFMVSNKPTFTKMNISGANGMIPAFIKGINHADRLCTGVNK